MRINCFRISKNIPPRQVYEFHHSRGNKLSHSFSVILDGIERRFLVLPSLQLQGVSKAGTREMVLRLSYSASSPPSSHHQNGGTDVQVGHVTLRSPSSEAGSELETIILGSRLVSFHYKFHSNL